MPKNVTLHRTEDQLEAFAYLASFAFFVLTHLRSPISLVTIALLGVNVFSIQDYVRSDKATVEVLKPVADNRPFSLMPEAMAQDKTKNQIVIDGKTYGTFDPEYECWKIAGKPAIAVHHKPSGNIFAVGSDLLETERVKSMKK